MTASTIAPTLDNRFERFGVLPWTDSDPAEAGGQDPRSGYVETFWLPTLGPSTTLMMRRFADRLAQSPDGFEVAGQHLSRELGLGTRLSARSPFVRTIERCITFNLAELRNGVLHVRQELPALSPRQLARLSPRLQELHEHWRQANSPSQHSMVIRATHVAGGLLALGDSPEAVESQLQRWQFAPAVAWHAVRQAGSPRSEQVG